MDRKIIVRYRDERYDLTEFMKKHPGGMNTLSGTANTDIDLKFDKTMPHSSAARHLIKEYKIDSMQVDECNNIEAYIKSDKIKCILEDNDNLEVENNL